MFDSSKGLEALLDDAMTTFTHEVGDEADAARTAFIDVIEEPVTSLGTGDLVHSKSLMSYVRVCFTS